MIKNNENENSELEFYLEKVSGHALKALFFMKDSLAK